MINAIFHFPTEGTPVKCEQIKSGHIHKTYLITTESGELYILQWINQYVFPNVNAIMNNVSAISAYLEKTAGDRVPMIRYLRTREDKSYYDDGNGGAWRAYPYVPNSLCLQRPETLDDFYECARAFGHFQYALNGFPARTLEETIPHFHDTVDRYRQFRQAMDADAAGRKAEVEREIAFLLEREERGCRLHRMMEEGTLPVRATHNDTKINNVLLDRDSRKAICVIDLDTVMPGLSVYDFGDAIRFGASTAAEDETDLSKVTLNLDLFRAFVQGFCRACPSLTEEEIRMLPQGAYTMTLECGMRFLTDYLNGDKYFSIDREKHNLDRAHAQFRLLEDMEQKWEDMARIVTEETGKS